MSGEGDNWRGRALRRIEDDRLVYYYDKADAGFWDSVWEKALTPEYFAPYEKGFLDHRFERVFTQYLPRDGRILEAGCGMGQFVVALRARGYDAEGVEWGEKTVEAVRAIKPDLPIRAGDVTNLEVPEGHYGGYISLGVVEHRQEGPEPFLDEAYRILAPGGVALISVPYFSPLRRLRARTGLGKPVPENAEFYQYAYPEDRIRSYIEAAGFEFLESHIYDCYSGLGEEVPGMARLFRVPGLGRYSFAVLRRLPGVERKSGHMIMIVARKPE